MDKELVVINDKRGPEYALIISYGKVKRKEQEAIYNVRFQ